MKGGDKAKYLLQDIKSYAYLNQSGCFSLSDVDDAASFESLNMAMTVLNIDENTCEGIFSLVSAVLLIGNLKFTNLESDAISLSESDKEIVAKMSKLLKVEK